MKIRDVVVHFVPVDFRTWVLVKVETDEGVHGWGEATVEWKARSVNGTIEELRELCKGEDPCNPRNLVRKLIKRHYWDPGVIGVSASSGIEVACWDILGKALGRPVADLFGGQVRQRVPLYTHLGFGRSDAVYGESMMLDAALASVDAIIEKGYQALKVVNVPYHSQYVFATRRSSYHELLGAILDRCRGRIDVALDVHGRCGSVASAEALLGFLQGRDVLFVEELLRPGSAGMLARLASRYGVRLATGERLVSRADFVDLATAGAVSIFQPDIAHCGGLLAAQEIAVVADAFGFSVAPHNPPGVVASTAGLHYALATPNFLIQEEMSANFHAAADFIKHPMQQEAGHWTLAPCTGLGVEVDEGFLGRLSGRSEPLLTEAAMDPDGSIADW